MHFIPKIKYFKKDQGDLLIIIDSQFSLI